MAKSSSSKRSTRKRVDRISGLPNDLLFRILAFLPTRSAMATSLLSHRWQYVWKGVPALNFFYDDANDIIYNCSSTEALEQYRCLRYFMNRALFQNRAPCLERVDFFVLPVINENDREVWFKELSRRSIKEVNLFYDEWCDVPIMCLLDGAAGKHLVALRLHCMSFNIEVTFSSMPYLPNLEIVHLSRVELDDGEPLRSLLCGCPRLRELVLSECSASALNLNLHCSTLKILKFLDAVDTEISIGVPNLEYFEYYNANDNFDTEFIDKPDYFRYLTTEMPCLAEVKIGSCDMKAARWADLFHKVRHVIKLNVSLGRFIDMDTTTMHFELPYFNRLKWLEIDCYEEHSVLQTRMLLRHMPNCVSLIIRMLHPWTDNAYELKGWPAVDSFGLGSYIEYIEIEGFGRTRLKGVELLRYLLVCCTRLKEMKLHLYDCPYSEQSPSLEQKNMMRKMIRKLPRPSGCKITIR
ncbi:hypothetical protein RND81_12G228500 [Saponaria officinalis]|uniref:F-box domain-containing protein n=1 Tax=Saponaria officinalis TaxID=3572 RepID=A0AAW1HE53_SAPOF